MSALPEKQLAKPPSIIQPSWPNAPAESKREATATPFRYVNTAFLRNMFNNNTDVINRMIDAFLSSTWELLDDLEESMANPDPESVRATLQSLRSCLTSLCVDRVAERTEYVEYIIKDDDQERFREECDILCKETRLALKELLHLRRGEITL